MIIRIFSRGVSFCKFCLDLDTVQFTQHIFSFPKLNTTKQKCPKSTHQRPKSTDVKPFSFEERNKLLIARKEEKIKKIIQEEEKV